MPRFLTPPLSQKGRFSSSLPLTPGRGCFTSSKAMMPLPYLTSQLQSAFYSKGTSCPQWQDSVILAADEMEDFRGLQQICAGCCMLARLVIGASAGPAKSSKLSHMLKLHGLFITGDVFFNLNISGFMVELCFEAQGYSRHLVRKDLVQEDKRELRHCPIYKAVKPFPSQTLLKVTERSYKTHKASIENAFFFDRPLH